VTIEVRAIGSNVDDPETISCSLDGKMPARDIWIAADTEIRLARATD
jgi:hypothetical protein